MRITRDLLHKFAQETVRQRKRSEPDLHAAYLTGSLLGDNPLLGGTTDIDLVLVHKYQAPVQREVEAITPEISLDIFHKIKDDYEQHRQLRHDPCLGYPLTYNHILLFDTDHWLEFIQSSVTATFHRADNVLERVNTLLDNARQNWFSLVREPSESHDEWLHRYFKTLSLSANALCGLIGPPLTNRRFLMSFSERAETLGVPKTLIGFNGLLGINETDEEQLKQWIEGLEGDLGHLKESSTTPPVHLSPCRHNYYLDAIKALSETTTPSQSAWTLLRIWLDVHLSLPQPSPNIEIWNNCIETLSLTEKNVPHKIEALDAYLDSLDIMIETWANTYGL